MSLSLTFCNQPSPQSLSLSPKCHSRACSFSPSMRGNTRGSCSFLRRGWVRCEVRFVGNLS
ncbi:MAG: hypothetical protein LBQ59_04575 [Candidatus Peribacteria bacterium]|nr:hypothetical protein [Candidatus Peribacteria bacterium]